MTARGQLIYLMLRCAGPALCSAFLLVLKCIAYRESRGRLGAGDWQQDGVILYSGDELTLLCKCQKVISSLTSFPPSNIFDEEIKSNTYGAQGHSEALNAYR